MKAIKNYALSGIKIHALSTKEAIEYILNLTKDKKAHYVVQPYVEFFAKQYRTEHIRQILNQATLCLANGVALQWAVHYQNLSNKNIFILLKSLLNVIFAPKKISQLIPERFDSNNFTWRLLEESAKYRLKIYLVGSPYKHPIEKTAKILTKRITGLHIVGSLPGRDKASNVFSPRLEEQFISDLSTLKPDIILVGLGFPLQEEIIHKTCKKIKHGVLIGEGGTFDYKQFGGHIKRAPDFIRRVGLEWLWRLIKQPKRFRRQLAIPGFIVHTYKNSSK